MTKTVLIFGASGRFGRNAGAAFEKAGWQVRRFRRDQDILARSADGADLIVNALNPQYTDWAAQLPGLHKEVRNAARVSGASVIIPGNVYVFGPSTPTPWSENSAHRATNPLGRLRTEMEEAYRADTVKTIVLRAGDFLDTEPSGNWFDKVMITKLNRDRFIYPGNPDIPHAWAYLPDLARATVALADMHDALPQFSDIPFAGYTLSGREMAVGLSDACGR